MNQIHKIKQTKLLAVFVIAILFLSLAWFYLLNKRSGTEISADGTVTLAFEDKKQGPDYDYNDFVVEIKINEVFLNNQLHEVQMHLKPKAKMGGYKSAFFLKLKSSQGVAFNGSFNGIKIFKAQSTEVSKTEFIGSFEESIIIFPDTSESIRQGQEVELKLQPLNPELNERRVKVADLYSRYIFGLDVTDKYGNKYQVEYLNQGLNLENATQRPLSILIPIKNWRIPKERTSSYVVYSELSQHINYLRGLVSEDMPFWYQSVTDDDLIEKENFLFKPKKLTPANEAPTEESIEELD